MRVSKLERAVIHSRYAEGKSHDEVAKTYGMTREQVKQIEEKAIRKIEINNPEHICDDCYWFWGLDTPNCHYMPPPRRKKNCAYWEPKHQNRTITDDEQYDNYQNEWN